MLILRMLAREWQLLTAEQTVRLARKARPTLDLSCWTYIRLTPFSLLSPGEGALPSAYAVHLPKRGECNQHHIHYIRGTTTTSLMGRGALAEDRRQGPTIPHRRRLDFLHLKFAAASPI